MPNQPSVNRVVTFVRVPVELMARLRSLAAERKMTITQVINFILHEELDDRPLTEADMEWIKQEVTKNENRRNKD